MSQRLSVTLGVCIAAAGVAAGALFVEPAGPPAPAPAAAVDGQHAQHQPTAPGGYGATPPGTPVEGQAAGAAAQLSIDNFTLQSITVSPGATVTVVNNDSAPHTATAQDGSFDTGTLAPGTSGTFTAPTTPGTYQIFCAIHPSMTATVTVA